MCTYYCRLSGKGAVEEKWPITQGHRSNPECRTSSELIPLLSIVDWYESPRRVGMKISGWFMVKLATAKDSWNKG